MKLHRHTNGLDYSVPETLQEAQETCGTNQTEFFPWMTRGYDPNNGNKGEVLRFGPVQTYVIPHEMQCELWFTVDGDNNAYAVFINDISGFYKRKILAVASYHVRLKSHLTHKIGEFGSSGQYDYMMVKIQPSHKETYLFPGGTGTIQEDIAGSRYANYHRAYKRRKKQNDPIQIAVDLFNEHVLIMKSLWKSETLALKRLQTEARAQELGVTSRDIKEQDRYRKRVEAHILRTQKTTEIMPELIKAKNEFEDFVSMLNSDREYTSQDVSKFQQTLETVKMTIDNIRHLGKYTL